MESDLDCLSVVCFNHTNRIHSHDEMLAVDIRIFIDGWSDIMRLTGQLYLFTSARRITSSHSKSTARVINFAGLPGSRARDSGQMIVIFIGQLDCSDD